MPITSRIDWYYLLILFKKKIMKKIIFLVLVLNLTLGLSAQEQKKTRKEIREERKQQQLEQQAANRAMQEKWVENKTFVLEANQVFSKRGDLFQLSPSTNFVYVKEDQAILQLSFNGLIGWNGVGGITVKGKIIKYEYDTVNKNIPIHIKMTIQGSEGFQDINLWISSNGNGEAQITDLRGNRIRFTGNVVSLEDSRVFIGNSRF